MKLLRIDIIRTCSILVVLSCTFSALKAQTVMQKLRRNSQTTHFARALENANLDGRLSGSGPYTIFVPSSSAFDMLSSNQKNKRDLLLNHILTGMATERSLKLMSNVTCLSGRTISVTNGGGQNISIDSYPIISSNIRADNGVIHVIDGVIN